jgi:hypothetical protein
MNFRIFPLSHSKFQSMRFAEKKSIHARPVLGLFEKITFVSPICVYPCKCWLSLSLSLCLSGGNVGSIYLIQRGTLYLQVSGLWPKPMSELQLVSAVMMAQKVLVLRNGPRYTSYGLLAGMQGSKAGLDKKPKTHRTSVHFVNRSGSGSRSCRNLTECMQV